MTFIFLCKLSFADCQVSNISTASTTYYYNLGNYSVNNGSSVSYNMIWNCVTTNTYAYFYTPSGTLSSYTFPLSNGTSTISASVSATSYSGFMYLTPCVNPSSGSIAGGVGPGNYGTWCGTISVPSGQTSVTPGTYTGRLTLTYKEAPTNLQWTFYINNYIDVILTVPTTCSVSSTGIDFGNVSSSQVNATGIVTSTCTNSTAYTLSASAGNTGDVYNRKLQYNGNNLNYGLYVDAAMNNIWGESGAGNNISLTGTGAAQTTTIYGKIPSGQYPAPGTYRDTLNITLTY